MIIEIEHVTKDEPLTNISTRIWDKNSFTSFLSYYVHARQELSLVTFTFVAMFSLIYTYDLMRKYPSKMLQVHALEYP